MLLLLRIIVLFLIIFNFRMPLIRYSASWAIALCTLIYLFQWKKIPLKYFFKRYSAYILLFLIGLCTYAYLFPIQRFTFDFGILDSFIVQLFLLLSILYVSPYIIGEGRDSAFNKVSEVIILTFALQAIIHLASFFNEGFGEFISGLKPESLREIVDVEGQGFRVFSLTGNPYFALPAGYGVAFILFFRLLLTSYSSWLFSGFKRYILFFILVAGAVLSGRTGFTGLFCASVMALLMNYRGNTLKIIQIAKSSVITVLLLGLIVFTSSAILSSQQLKAIEKDVFPFAFEFLYNYDKSGEFSTLSTDYLTENMYFNIPEETFFLGDARYSETSGGYYKSTDAGYMRQILFGGVIYLLILIVYQLLYFYTPMKTALERRFSDGWNDFLCWLTLLVYLFILNYKGEAIGTMQIMQCLFLLLGLTYLTENEYLRHCKTDYSRSTKQETI